MKVDRTGLLPSKLNSITYVWVNGSVDGIIHSQSDSTSPFSGAAGYALTSFVVSRPCVVLGLFRPLLFLGPWCRLCPDFTLLLFILRAEHVGCLGP